jgi:hypothetical protein
MTRSTPTSEPEASPRPYTVTADILDRIEQRLNESGTGEMGLLDTIHAVAAMVREARTVAQAAPARDALAKTICEATKTYWWQTPNQQRENREWYDAADAAIALVGAPRADGCTAWEPIETAPNNHLPVQAYGPYGQLVAFRDVHWLWWSVPNGEDPLNYTPTHWKPLGPGPALPSTERGR